MKAKIYSKTSLLLFISILFHSSLLSNSLVQEIYANQNFTVTNQQDFTQITMDKNPWESFTIAVNNYEIQQSPLISLDLMTSDEIEIRVDITDGNYMSHETAIVEKRIEVLNNFTSVSFDFSELLDGINLNEQVYLVFYVNPGKAYKGNLFIRDFSLTENVIKDEKPSETLDGFNMYPSPATTFTNIEIPNGNFTSIAIFDINGRLVMTENVAAENGTTFTLELSNLTDGYYTVRLSGVNSSLTEKLIIN